MDIGMLFLIVAIILFLLSAFGVASARVNLQSLGLAFFAGSFLIVGGMLS